MVAHLWCFLDEEVQVKCDTYIGSLQFDLDGLFLLCLLSHINSGRQYLTAFFLSSGSFISFHFVVACAVRAAAACINLVGVPQTKPMQ